MSAEKPAPKTIPRWRQILSLPWLVHTVAVTFFPIRTRALLLSDVRGTLSGNLEFIDKALRDTRPDIPITQFLRTRTGVRRSFTEKLRLPFLIGTSSHIILDDYYSYLYRLQIRSGVHVIQAWHAAGAFKKVGYSRDDLDPKKYRESLSHRGYTDAIVSSEMIRNDYAEAFDLPLERVHATGIPRTDVFFDRDYLATTRATVREEFGVSDHTQFVLYAPTFRGTGHSRATFDFDIIDWQTLAERLPDDTVVVIKPHPFIKNFADELLSLTRDGVHVLRSAADRREINDLLIAADVLITDYSSVIFEFSLLDRPVLFYTPDLNDYGAGRSFYYPFEHYQYGKVCQTTEELITALHDPRLDTEKLAAFKRDFMSACDGRSAQRFVEFFFRSAN